MSLKTMTLMRAEPLDSILALESNTGSFKAMNQVIITIIYNLKAI